ncbi:MAG: CDP-glycerol glycerophosphotransferase family protein [Moraxellaceae bacterium]|uniref:CDP-glycerol glycerophosphotransferase family protein n=1 Tax=Psychrobacter sp. TaxID=56811 RepID=UPI003F973FB7
MIDKLLKRLIYSISGLSKRNPKKWVFASHNRFSDNSRYLFEDKYNPYGIRKIWVAKNKNEYNYVSSLGYECYIKGSYKAFIHSLTAKYFIYTCYISDIGFQYSKNAIAINLWHGFPLKKIEFDIKKGPLTQKFNSSIKSKIKHPEIYRSVDYILCPSDFVYSYSYKTAFRVSQTQILRFPYPRSIYLKSLPSSKNAKYVFLYAPTWRDNKVDFLNSDYLDLNKINSFCKKNDCLFKIKLHPNTKHNINVNTYDNIIFVDTFADTNTYLAEADCLITDYSSIFFDFLVLDRPILFYVFDEDTYKLQSREIYSEVEDIVVGEKLYNLDSLLNMMLNNLVGNDKSSEQRKNTIKLFNLSFNDTDNKRLIDTINHL